MLFHIISTLDENYIFSYADRVDVGVVMLVLALIGLITHIFSFSVILRVKEFRNAFGYLCLSDSACAIAIMLQFLGYTCPMTMLAYKRPQNSIFYNFIDFNMIYLYYVSMYTHAGTSLNRFLAIRTPNLYRRLFTYRNNIIFGLSVWIIAMIQCIAFFIDSRFFFDNELIQWVLSSNSCGVNYSFYIDFLYSCILMLSLFLLDCYAFYYLRQHRYYVTWAQNSCKTTNKASRVCACDANYCDTFPLLGALQNDQVAVYTSSLSGQRFNRANASFSNNNIVLTVDSSIRYQKIHGFGTAFTGTASYNIMRLPQGARQKLMEAYFGQDGIEFTMGRVPMGASDFSLSDYTYDDTPNDFNLTNFNLGNEDLAYKIPVIKMAQNIAGENLKLFSSPWSAPAWMKTTNNTRGENQTIIIGPMTGKPNETKYWNTYANYFLRFFEEYAKTDIKYWGLTIQNEPTINTSNNGMFVTAGIERDFIKYWLGPRLQNNPLTQNLSIMIWDFNRGGSIEYVDTVLQDKAAASYVSGVAMHWYDDIQFGLPSTYPQTIHDRHPDKWILNTEACNGWMGGPDKGVTLGNWTRAELYAHDILDNLNHWSTGWVDWNMALNETGGPAWIPNAVDAPIIVDNGNSTFYKQPMFYAFGHFSKFVRPGSYRINTTWNNATQNSQNSSTNSGLEVISFITPTKLTVVVIHNSADSTNYTVYLQEARNSCKNVKLTIEQKSITTVVWNNTSPCGSNQGQSGSSSSLGSSFMSVMAIFIAFFISRPYFS